MKTYVLVLLLFTSFFTVSAQDTEPLFRIIENGKFGFINRKGKVVIPAEFSYAYDFSEGLAFARKEGKYGYINKKGQWKVQPTFPFHPDFIHYQDAIQLLKAKEALLIKNLRLQSQIKIQDLSITNEKGVYTFWLHHKRGLFDSSGNILFEPGLSSISDFEHHRAVVTVIDDKTYYGLIDLSGKWALPLRKNVSITQIGEGFLRVAQYPILPKDTTWREGVTLYSPRLRRIECPFPLYDFEASYSQGHITVYLPKKPLEKKIPFYEARREDFYVAYVDTNGRLVQNGKRLAATPEPQKEFTLTPTVVEKKLSYVDKTGKVIWSQKNAAGYDTKNIRYYSNSLGKGAKLKPLPNYECGKEKALLKLVNRSNTEEFKGDTLRYHFELINTSCDTFITYGFTIHFVHNNEAHFGALPIFEDRDCSLITGDGFAFPSVPPRHAVAFSIPKTRGRETSTFYVRAHSEYQVNNSLRWEQIEVESEAFEGKITFEEYGYSENKSFIDHFYYQSLHEAYQNDPYVNRQFYKLEEGQ